VVLTPLQISELWPVSLSTVYALVRSGKLAAYRIGAQGKGRKILIRQEDWENFLATTRVSEWPREEEGGLQRPER
jgi:excisionase family DNA binding protein